MTSVAAGLRAAGATDVGRKRSVNEDRFFVDAARGVFVVVDGVGGHAAGDKAADTAVGVLADRLTQQTGSPTSRLTEAITAANNEIHRLAGTKAEWRGMACVLTAAIVTGNRVAVGHVGDSRLYRLYDGRLEKVTPDHSPIGVREDARELSELEAMSHPRRNEVYRDVGSERHEASDPDFVFVTEIDYPEGAALLLCSDGLTDLVPSNTIRQIALTHAGAPESVAKALVTAANDAGGKDNVTVVYVERGAAHPMSAPIPARSRLATIMAVIVTAVLAFAAGFYANERGWLSTNGAAVLRPASPGVVVVRPEESISAALAQASAGSTVLVEPGEYRERLVLRDNIRVVSRIPRGATLRLPGASAEGDAAVIAAGIANAELSGFRIVGDASTPLGIGIVTRDASVRLMDLEVSGATTHAIELGAGDNLTLSGSEVHRNAGAALLIRTGSTARIANNVFRTNGTPERNLVPFVIESSSVPVWTANVFAGVSALALPGPDAAAREKLLANNWFIAPPPPSGTAGPGRRGGREGRSQ